MRRLVVLAAALAAGLGCDPVGEPPSPPPPANFCPNHPCSAYQQPNPPECQQGTCVVRPQSIPVDGGVSPTGDLFVLISMSQDAVYGPGRTLVSPYDALAGGTDAGSGRLSQPIQAVSGYYLVSPSLAQEVHWNVGTGGERSLPIHASFTPLSFDGVGVDAGVVRLLPLDAVIADVTLVSQAIPGPGQGLGTLFSAFLPAGLYKQTLTPDAPFNQAFGPVSEVLPACIPQGGQCAASYEPVYVDSFDLTSNMMNANRVLPVFTITGGPIFDGWTAYLRDSSTGEVLSSVAPLWGANPTFTLTGKRLGDPDALSAPAELVVAPPPGSHVATELFFFALGYSPSIPFLPLPDPVTTTGSIAASDGSPVPSDLAFEAIGIMGLNGQFYQTPLSANPYVEFTTWATADLDPSSGRARFEVVLPPGLYRLDVRPRDAVHAMTSVEFAVPAQNGWTVRVGVPQPTTGFAQIADGRRLANATVEATPTGCASLPPLPAALGGAAPLSTPWCQPRAFDATTQSDGSFVLYLDPGDYNVVVRPPGSSRLPWVSWKPIHVDATAPPLGTLSVPAPLHVGLLLTDPIGQPISNALVRIFRVFQSSSVELGAAVTGADGRYEMYVAPP